jgi:hypothetical protein
VSCVSSVDARTGLFMVDASSMSSFSKTFNAVAETIIN